jgi:hypothetical protein
MQNCEIQCCGKNRSGFSTGLGYVKGLYIQFNAHRRLGAPFHWYHYFRIHNYHENSSYTMLLLGTMEVKKDYELSTTWAVA